MRGAGSELCVTGEFSFNASHYTQEELTKKRHNFELEKVPETVLCLDFAHSGLGSNSCGPKLLEKGERRAVSRSPFLFFIRD